jgi:uncharacterized protein YqeY
LHPKERLQEDLKTAMKAGETARRDTLRLLTAAIRQVEVDQRKTLGEDEVFALLNKEAQKRRDSIQEARKAGRDDVADKEQASYYHQIYLPNNSPAKAGSRGQGSDAETGLKTAGHDQRRQRYPARQRPRRARGQ